MVSVVITEKPSQARDVTKAVGTQYGQVLPAQGHVMRLAEPEEVNPAWGRWTTDLLRPESGHYPLREDKSAGKGERLALLKPALKAADIIYCSTDCDREGTLIGGNLIKTFGNASAKVLRVVFTAQDPATLQKAFANARPWSEFALEFDAGEARSQADQIYNLSLTRAATVLLKEPGTKGAIGIGRVKTPTLAIVCRRELEIGTFETRAYFEIVVQAAVAGGRFSMRHAPKVKIESRKQADEIAGAAEGWAGPLSVLSEAKRRAPPRLLDLPGLQKACSARFGWTAEKTLKVAQDLYQNHGHLLTYPRAESKYLAETMIVDAVALTEQLAGLYGLPVEEPVIRRGSKDAVYYDKGLEGVSHHAVIPNINGDFSKVADLDDDSRSMFDLVAKVYLAAHMPDHLYQQTTITALVSSSEFRAVGRITTSPGWKSVFEDVEEDDGEDSQSLPVLANGEAAQLAEAKVEAKKTKPPPRYTEGTLIQAMQEAWRFVEEGPLRERLKEAKGLGTPATRDQVISGLKSQDMLVAKGKQLAPSPQGMALFKLLVTAAPRLVDPGVTAVWEQRLDQVVLGQVTADQVIAEIAGEAEKIITALKDGAENGSLVRLSGKSGPSAAAAKYAGQPRLEGNAPSDAKLALAKKLADEAGMALQDGAVTDFRICTKFIEERMAAKAKDAKSTAKAAGVPPKLANLVGRAPSEKQVSFAKKLATEKAITIPPGTLEDMAKTSAFIDRLLKPAPKKRT
jgi:DNA topoisomerase-3